MRTSRRTFLKGSLAGAAAAGINGYTTVLESQVQPSRSESLLKRDSGLPAAASFDRLPLEWYKNQVGRLKAKMRELNADAILLRDPLNIVYFTGYFYINTERPYSVLIPVEEDSIYWFYPGWWTHGGKRMATTISTTCMPREATRTKKR